jgi:hypothetical protein
MPNVITVAETLQYRRKAKGLLSSVEQSEVITYLSANPKAGVLIEETGGIRKLRWRKAGRGKSAGVRVIYYYHSEVMPLYLLTVFGKNERASLSRKEKRMLSKAVKRLVEYWREKNG